MLPEMGRTPANTQYGGISEEYELISVNLDDVIDSREKWEELYTELMRETGSAPMGG